VAVVGVVVAWGLSEVAELLTPEVTESLTSEVAEPLTSDSGHGAGGKTSPG
jgi:hypothetical protein